MLNTRKIVIKTILKCNFISNITCFMSSGMWGVNICNVHIGLAYRRYFNIPGKLTTLYSTFLSHTCIYDKLKSIKSFCSFKFTYDIVSTSINKTTFQHEIIDHNTTPSMSTYKKVCDYLSN